MLVCPLDSCHMGDGYVYINLFLSERLRLFINSPTHTALHYFSRTKTSINHQSTCLTPAARIFPPVRDTHKVQYPYCARDTNFMSAEAKEEITPDSSKSTQDKIKETVTDTTDRVARGFQSDDSKSAPQQAFDKTQRTHDNEAHGGATSSM